MAWPNSQKRRVKLTIQSGVVSGSAITHSNFICAIFISNLPSEMFSSTDGNRAQANGEDIRAALNSDGTGQIPIDVMEFETNDGSSSIVIFVKLDVTSDSDTDFYLAYNTTDATSKDAATATFGSENVYTECELAALTDSTSMTDRSGNHTLSIDDAPTYSAGSPLENFASFAGNNRLSNADAVLRDILTTYDTTMSFWVRDSAYVLGNHGVFSWEGTDDFVIYPYDDTESGFGDDLQRVFWRDLSNTLLIIDLVPAMTVDDFHLLHFTTRASNDHELLIDGASKGTSSDTGTAGPFTKFHIGGFGATDQDYDGDLANVIVWATARSNDWCNTEYANQNSPSTFIVEGTPEDVAAGLPTGYAVEGLASGFELQITFPDWEQGATYTLDPDGTPNVTLTVTSEGFDNTGSATTIERPVVATDILRLPGVTTDSETDSGTSTIVKFSLSDFIFDTDTYTITVQNVWAQDTAGGNEEAETWTDEAGTNSSTLTHPLPIANWAEPPLGLYANADFSVELVAFHGYPLDGKPVAAVKFTLTDSAAGTNIQTETAPVLLSKYNDLHPIYGYRPTFDISGLADGAFDIRAEVFPWVGDAAAVLDTDDSIGTFPALTGYLDAAGNYKICYASVTTGGNDGTGVASKTEATADASPYLTIGAALAGIRTVNNTVAGSDIVHDDAGRGRVKLGTGTFAPTGTAPGTLETTQGAVWAEVIDDSGGSSIAVLQKHGGNDVTSETKLLKYDGLVVTNTENRLVFWGPATDDSDLWFHNCNFTDTNHYGAHSDEWNKIYGTEVISVDTHWANFAADRGHTAMLRGCDVTSSVNLINIWRNLIIGCDLHGFGIKLIGRITSNHASITGVDNLILAFNKCHSLLSENLWIGGVSGSVDQVSVAIVQNVIESLADQDGPVLELYDGGSGATAINNFVIQHNTIVGNRVNMFYNDADAVIPALDRIFSKYNIFEGHATKHDLFTGIDPASATRINAWSFLWSVGQRGNVIVESVGGFSQEYIGLNGTDQPSTINYTDDQSENTVAPGDGDYTIATAGDEANRLPATGVLGGRMFDRDFVGVLRLTDGVGNAGAYETAAAGATILTRHYYDRLLAA